MSPIQDCVLAINGGSSSIRFALYRIGTVPVPVLAGKVDRIGTPAMHLVFHDMRQADTSHRVDAAGASSAIGFLMDWLQQQIDFAAVRVIGHRVVHGMQHSAPQAVTPNLLNDLRRIIGMDLDHLPFEIELIDEFQRRHPQLPQVVCFDTAFHRNMPRVAQLLPIPRRYQALGIKRYGFHGLSYAYLMQQLAQIDPAAARGRVLLAHLGNGASMTAVHDGHSLDTSMGLTPAGGLPMGTRPGDMDPGVADYLLQAAGLSLAQFSDLINHEAGLLGISESSADMRDLLDGENDDARAADAVAFFCYQAKKWIGAFAAVLNGVDTLVFAGGIGENAPPIRARICDGLQFLGIEVDAGRNAAGAGVISTPSSRVVVRVMHTDEEWMIATTSCRVLEQADKEHANGHDTG